jgi:hypothetical protein
MKFGGINARISPIAIAVVVFFAILLAVSYLITRDTSLLIWGIPAVIFLFVIPVALNYMSRRQYADLEPEYRRLSRDVRVKMINESMIGKPVRIEGVVERVFFRHLNRPRYLIGDRTGEISVKMFTTPQEDVTEGDIVEVMGMVIHRFIVTGDPVINCVVIKKLPKKKNAAKDTSKD